MIVKDEVGTLPGLFASCRGVIDCWVICDTGSSDGTQELIRRELAGIPGELHERPWVDFGTNRTESLRFARGAADYLLILDADTTIEVAPGTLDGLTDDAYMLRHEEGGTVYFTKRLVRGDLEWRYVGAVHEYITSEDERTTGRLDGLTIASRSVGALRTGRFERDARLLEAGLELDPGDARARFYLAQTYRDLAFQRGDERMLERAAEEYQRRADMPGWIEETYVARYQAGVLLARLGRWPEAAETFTQAWELRPERLEAAHALAAGLRERRRYRTAHRLTTLAADLEPLPVPGDVLFVEPWIYEWGMLFEYSVTAYWVGEHERSVAACRRLLERRRLPDEYRRLTEGNLEHALRERDRLAQGE